MSKDKPVRIIAILDKSGSMETMRDTAIDGFNSFMNEQKGVEGRAVLSLIFFNHGYQVVHTDRKLTKLRNLTREDYAPSGRTALRDAVGRTVSDAMINEDDFSQTVVFIMTDGQENASTEWAADDLRELIESAQDEHGWQFFFAAANIDAFATAGDLGIDASGAMAYAASDEGTRKAFTAASSYIAEARSGNTGDEDPAAVTSSTTG